jgi:tRNA A-37 threonylcarbamoyl transferase component Bud32
MSRRKCLSDDELLAVLTDSGKTASAREHLQSCGDCRDRIRDKEAEISTHSMSTPQEGQHGRLPTSVRTTTQIGRYPILKELDRGAQAEVYRAIHPTLDKDVVIKLSRWELNPSKDRDRLVQEGQLLATLDHPNLAHVYDLDFHQNRPFLVMEYVPGRNLEQLQQDRKLPHTEAAVLVAQLARATDAAHRLGIIHKDIKPRNAIVDGDGNVRLLDFGMARLRSAWSEDPSDSPTISGTPAYMAPEQARGESQSVTAKADIFALGAVLYSLVCGQAPFVGTDRGDRLRLASNCDFDRSALRDAGAAARLQQICLHAMEADPANRYASAEDLARDLERFAGRARLWPRAVLGAAVGVLLLVSVLIARNLVSASSATEVNEPQIWVQRDGRQFTLRDAVPLSRGDEIKIIGELPAGNHGSLWWFDASGKLTQLPYSASDSSPLQTMSCGWVGVEGTPGTEVILFCVRSSKPATEGEIRAAISLDRPWPPLPDTAILRLDKDRIRVSQDRGPGRIRAETDDVLSRARAWQQSLAHRFDFVFAIAFTHNDPLEGAGEP